LLAEQLVQKWTGFSGCRTSIELECGLVGRLRLPTDVRRTACHCPFHPANGHCGRSDASRRCPSDAIFLKDVQSVNQGSGGSLQSQGGPIVRNHKFKMIFRPIRISYTIGGLYWSTANMSLDVATHIEGTSPHWPLANTL
jgi:hypothetical protein